MFPSQDISVGRSLVTVFFCHHWFLSSLLRSYLVGGLEHEFYCSIMFHILGISSSQLTHIFQRGRSTTNQEPAINSYPPNHCWRKESFGVLSDGFMDGSHPMISNAHHFDQFRGPCLCEFHCWIRNSLYR